MRIDDTPCSVERCLVMNEFGQVVLHLLNKLLISHVANQSISIDMCQLEERT
jgi:hypothetical protein